MSMLAGRRVVVTGAGGGGLGRQLALTCARAGANLILSDIAESGLQETAEAVRAGGGTAETKVMDLSDPESIADFGRTVEGPLHGLINNGAIATGIGGVGFEDITAESWDRVMTVNVRGTWLLIRALAPLLRASACWGSPAPRFLGLASFFPD